MDEGTTGSNDDPKPNRFGMENVRNFRDVGGLRTADGRTVRSGQIYRSGEPGEASEHDLAVLSQLGVKTFCDLRSAEEVERTPNPALAGAVTVSVSVAEDSTDTAKVRTALTEGRMADIGAHRLISGNRGMVERHGTVFATVVRMALDPAQRPMLIHCSAGKDRAGLASAVLLLALGVAEDEVMKNFLWSNVERAQANDDLEAMVRGLMAERDGVAPESIDMEPLRAMLEVRPEYLQAALDTMVERHGSVADYLADGLGLSADELGELRDQLLTD